MNEIENNKKTLVITILAAVILFILIVIYFFIQKRISTPQKLTPTPTVSPVPTGTLPTILPSDNQGPAPGQVGYEINQETENQLEAVANLTYLVPFKGQFFSIEYSESSGNYEVTIQESNKAAGEKEFDEFLQKNKIKTREWIPNLVVRYQ